MFQGCNNYTGRVYLGSNVINCQSMFQAVNGYNYVVSLPNSVKDCSYMYQGVNGVGWYKTFTFPSSCNNLYYCFGESLLNANIYINCNGRTEAPNIAYMLGQRTPGLSTSYYINIYCNNLSYLNKTTAGETLVGTTMTWSKITNGYCDYTYRVNIYNNYEG